MDFFFPSLADTEDNPAETLQAPFAHGTQEGEEAPEENKSIVPLNLQHRTAKDIEEWTVTAVSDAMSFGTAGYEADFEEAKPDFDAGGWGQYQTFLEEKKIMRVLKSGQYDVRSYVKGTPILLNEGAVSGRYRWLYEVPIMVSYLKRGVTDYKNVEPVNQNMALRVQVGRVEDPQDDYGLSIERWSGTVKQVAQQQ
ncbi:MAG: DotI/IcmL family type IV secretion protein [Pseudomonadota bacterium]